MANQRSFVLEGATKLDLIISQHFVYIFDDFLGLLPVASPMCI
jgi:hypothetical protein